MPSETSLPGKVVSEEYSQKEEGGNPVLNKCLKRILISIPVLIGVVLIIFIMLRIIPGNPVTTMLGEHVNQAVIDKVSREMGLDQPLYIQFFRYVANALQGDFGTSYRLNRNVTGIILEAFPNTVKLSVCAAVVAWIIGIVAGIVAAVKQNRLLDRPVHGMRPAGGFHACIHDSPCASVCVCVQA